MRTKSSAAVRSRYAFHKYPRLLKAFSLIEVVIFMGVIVLTSAAFTLAASQAAETQILSKRSDISSQVSAGVLEQSQSLPWSSLGFRTTDTGYVSTYEGRATVNLPVNVTDRLYPRQTRTIKGVQVTSYNYITWLQGPTATNHGTKRVTTIVEYTAPDGTLRTQRFQFDRTSKPNEAVVDGTLESGAADPIPAVPTPTVTPPGTATGGDEDGVTGYEYDPTLGGPGASGCTEWSVSTSYGQATFSWTRVSGASYQFYVNNVQQGSVSSSYSGNSYTLTNLPEGRHKFALVMIRGGLTYGDCGYRYGRVEVPPPMVCPAPVSVDTPSEGGTIIVSWPAVRGAAQYKVYYNRMYYSSSVRTVDAPNATTTISGLPSGTYTVRVTAVRGADESAGCSTATVTVRPPRPDCPTVNIEPLYDSSTYYFYVQFITKPNTYYVNYSVYPKPGNSGSGTSNYQYTYGSNPQYFYAYVYPYYTPGYWDINVSVAGSDGYFYNCDPITFHYNPPPPDCPTNVYFYSYYYYYYGYYYYFNWSHMPRANYYIIYRNGSHYTTTSYPGLYVYANQGDNIQIVTVDSAGRQSQNCASYRIT